MRWSKSIVVLLVPGKKRQWGCTFEPGFFLGRQRLACVYRLRSECRTLVESEDRCRCETAVENKPCFEAKRERDGPFKEPDKLSSRTMIEIDKKGSSTAGDAFSLWKDPCRPCEMIRKLKDASKRVWPMPDIKKEDTLKQGLESRLPWGKHNKGATEENLLRFLSATRQEFSQWSSRLSAHKQSHKHPPLLLSHPKDR